ncbi:MAG: DUF2393 domain-containing protein [Sulfurimonas sp.]|jgi:uncharacterized membrane protein YeiB|nr:DUF2393 domain-containing protein [Sulfurimonas sp.]MBU1217015.1 DUF2393 domain-containing protein [bacterium]MBU1435426.1 DUF2393 domain-containing protein [bacterium]MBU1502263.1 DUF2393 domain-containing protein [bacterium]MBU3940203.1 DUF2393 domain-containing protein [bacterium]
MTTLFNYWHYFTLIIIFILYIGGLIAAFRQEKKKLIFPMAFSVTLVFSLLAIFSVVVVDKYTKVVKLYKLENKRLLSTEQIIYTGVVKNEGKYTIGEVIFEIKLVNKGHVTGNVKAGSFFAPSGFAEFFGGGANVLYKPQTIIKEFVVATNLKPGEAEQFRVYFDFPPYFRNVADFSTVRGH